jgi:hypothetical protein
VPAESVVTFTCTHVSSASCIAAQFASKLNEKVLNLPMALQCDYFGTKDSRLSTHLHDADHGVYDAISVLASWISGLRR